MLTHCQEQALKKIAELKGLIHTKLDMPEFRMPEVFFDLTGRSAGLYHGTLTPNNRMINEKLRFNNQLLQENLEDFLASTITHEVAHAVAAQRYGKVKAHGREWTTIMLLLGANPKRCHNYDVKNVKVRKQKRFNYTCGCPNKMLKITTTRHNKISKLGKTYRCARCRHKIIPA